MSTFLQLHLLTSYPPSNLNRDDLGRPKTAIVGGKNRLRVSSQSLKRAWRTSDVFEKELGSRIGVRTGKLILELSDCLKAGGYEKNLAEEIAKNTCTIYEFPFKKSTEKKPKSAKRDTEENSEEESPEKMKTDLLVFYNTSELDTLRSFIKQLVHDNKDNKDKINPTNDEWKKLKDSVDNLRDSKSVNPDVALFGRMMASAPSFNIEAAAQIAHAITVHEVAVEDDYFTAIDDLSKSDTQGAGHLGETEFGAGVYYLYACINVSELRNNLNNDELAQRTLIALLHAATKVAPTGKQNSFASRAYASYVMLEQGSQQPRSLHTAFLKPVKGKNDDGIDVVAIKELEQTRKAMDKAYNMCADSYKVMNVSQGEGTFADLTDFIKQLFAKG